MHRACRKKARFEYHVDEDELVGLTDRTSVHRELWHPAPRDVALHVGAAQKLASLAAALSSRRPRVSVCALTSSGEGLVSRGLGFVTLEFNYRRI
jgi:hypothetical protein